MAGMTEWIISRKAVKSEKKREKEFRAGKKKFKFGDRVIVNDMTGGVYLHSTEGSEGRVISYNELGRAVVQFDYIASGGFAEEGPQSEWAIEERHLDKITAHTIRLRKNLPKIEISVKIHNTLAKAASLYTENGWYPRCYLIGKSKTTGIITHMTGLNKSDMKVHNDETGCRSMIFITQGILAKALVKLTEQGFVPCGIARVGNFKLGASHTIAVKELGYMNKDMYMLSYSLRGVEIHSYDPDTHKYQPYRYTITI